jgi:hypothetical protein
MRHKKSSIHLVKSLPDGMTSEPRTFRTGDIISQSGIYRVIHRQHRLPHEVTLLRDGKFPRCAKCQDAVQFQLIKPVAMPELSREFSIRITLYELPVLDEDQEKKAAG